MDQTWLITSGLTIFYIIILVVYFARRSKSHEKELVHFLETAKQKLEEHKQITYQEANQKVVKAMEVVKKVELAAQNFESQAQEEYNNIIEEAKSEKKEVIDSAKEEIRELFDQAQEDLKIYQEERQLEIEKNLVKLVVSVSEKVTEISLSEKMQKDLVYKALDEIKSKKSRI